MCLVSRQSQLITRSRRMRLVSRYWRMEFRSVSINFAPTSSQILFLPEADIPTQSTKAKNNIIPAVTFLTTVTPSGTPATAPPPPYIPSSLPLTRSATKPSSKTPHTSPIKLTRSTLTPPPLLCERASRDTRS